MDAIWGAIISSTVVSSVVAGAISVYQARHAQHVDFKNKYYHQVIQKRMAAYEAVEKVLVSFSDVRKNEFGAQYHAIFNKITSNSLYYSEVMNVLNNTMWVGSNSAALLQELHALSFYVVNISKSKNDHTKWASTYYKEIETLRKQLTASITDDLLDLYDVVKFLESKKYTVQLRDILDKEY